jgi:hypothetical protein
MAGQDPKQPENPYAAIMSEPLPHEQAMQTAADAGTQEPGVMSQIGTGIENFGKGLGKSAIGLMSTGDDFARAHLPAFFTNKNLGFGPPADEQHIKDLATPHTPGQSFGKGLGDMAQFFIPGDAEAAAAEKLPMLGRFAKPLMKMIGGETVNEAQGGPKGAGAVGAGIGEGIGALMRKGAPFAAQTAMRIPSVARAFGKTPGEAILNETKGILPSTVGKSAQESTNRLTSQVEQAADRASVRPEGGAPIPATEPNPIASLRPARGVLGDAGNQAVRENAASRYAQIQPMVDTLSSRFNTGEPIPENVTPRQLLDLKRGFSDEHLGRWNPDLHAKTTATARQAYHALDQEFDRTVPEGAETNQKISSLIPVIHAADKAERAPSLFQRTAGRIGAHTGALTMGGMGALGGYHAGGLPGAIALGAAGLVGPELMASPESQMILARTMGNKGVQNAAAPLMSAATSKLMKSIREVQ